MATFLLCALLAAPASLPVILEQGQGEFHLWVWVTALVCTLIASVCLFVSTRLALGRDIPAWCLCVSSASFAAFGPLAVSSTVCQIQANLGMAALALAMSVGLTRARLLRWTVGLLLAALACSLDATALVWPIGWLWSGLARRQGRQYALVLLLAGVAGIVWDRMLGHPALTGYRMQGAIYLLHRDVVLLMPIIVLGVGGLARFRNCRRAEHRGRANAYMVGWAVASVCALLLAVLGCPVNVRLCVLGMWWLMPTGLSELVQMLTSDVSRRLVVRRIGFLVSAMLAMLSIAGLCGWRDGLLLAVYLLVERG